MQVRRVQEIRAELNFAGTVDGGASNCRGKRNERTKRTMYDPELPRGFQDADFEMRDLQRAANRESRLEKQGICCHGHFISNAEGTRCYKCNSTFRNRESLFADRDARLGDDDLRLSAETTMVTGTYVLKPGEWEAILDGKRIDATFNSKGAAEAGIEVERRRREKRSRSHHDDRDYGGVLGGDGMVYSDADQGL